MSKRVLSLLMALVLCLSMLPVPALAEMPAAIDGGMEVESAAEPENEPAELLADAEDKPQGDGTQSSPYLIGSIDELEIVP